MWGSSDMWVSSTFHEHRRRSALLDLEAVSVNCGYIFSQVGGGDCHLRAGENI